ncbi:MAG TPA: ATP-dependent DNA helicase RecG, partial [Thermoanaerobaculia bacterium]|nr:ATP-dependent DNA helicase RecG [Thermoanaerobaculia bacterium]
MLGLRSPLSSLRGIGPTRGAALAEAGVERVVHLLFHLPFRYEDRRRLTGVGDIASEGTCVVRGRLSNVSRIRRRGRRGGLVRACLRDGGGELKVLWFNRPYLAAQLDEAVTYLLCGRVSRTQKGDWQMTNPSVEPADEAVVAGHVVPVYSALGGLGPAAIRRLLAQVLEALDLESEVPDRVPTALRQRYGLPSLGSALEQLHRPSDNLEEKEVEALNSRRSLAHARLIYGELLELQVELARVRQLSRGRSKRHRYRCGPTLRRKLLSSLPFEPTGSQERVFDEISRDLLSPSPMRRLLQGDVGCGKTAVAALALALAIENGLQGLFMAPTELLAQQHLRSLRGLLGGRYEIGLLTASAPNGGATVHGLASGRIQLAVGTHALIEERVEVERLGLVVVDEQHRFGVDQRLRLEGKGDSPDLLVMTATPIPRSLALTAYGDLDLSVIDELPPGRLPVATEVIAARGRAEVYRRLREELESGAQAYVVLPLIDESERLEAASIEALGERIRTQFSSFASAVVHGRLPADEREARMRSFARGETRLLIATTVIEVGVDVPEATLMVIENAERFGLAQLH